MIDFLGYYESTLDVKGRFLLPAGFKKQLPEGENSVIISRGFEGCLTLYPKQSWEPIRNKIAGLNDFDPKVRKFKREFLGGATEVEMDTAGRLLLASPFKEFAGLSKDIVLAAVGNKIEIWNAARYKHQFVDNIDPDEFSNLAKDVMGDKPIYED